jgi:hypothetical protein
VNDPQSTPSLRDRIDQLQGRLDRLEANNTRLRVAVFAVGLLALAGFLTHFMGSLGGRAPRADGFIEAKGFAVREGPGQPLAVLGMSERGPVLEMLSRDGSRHVAIIARDDGTHLLMGNKEGGLVSVETGAKGSALRLDGPGGKSGVELAATEKGGAVTRLDAEGGPAKP